MEYKEIEINDVKVLKCIGDGQCSCKTCTDTIGFNVHWTCGCYKYNDDIYCYKHICELLENKKGCVN